MVQQRRFAGSDATKDGGLVTTCLEQLAREAGVDAVATEARALAERAADGRFYVACVGQFKRGKSTLLNALVGDAVLPTGVVPVTSVPTVLRCGDRAARVRRAGGAWQEVDPARLADFVSEQRNPGNRKQVQAVEVFLPSPLLASGLCFVDTPGLGSVFEANSAATREFIPQIDAALVVLGADPPISGEEIRLVEEIAREVDCLIFVLSKADRAAQQELAEGAAFAQRVLSERLGRPVERIYQVSGTEWTSSGKPERDRESLAAELQALADRSGRSLVAAAVRRGVARLAARLRHALAEEAAALLRPIAESEERLQALRAAADQARQALRDLGPLFTAEEQRQARTFADRRTRFLEAVKPEAGAALRAALRTSGPHSGPALRRRAFQLAQEIARERIAPWLAESETAADAAYRAASTRFLELANGFLAQLRGSEDWTALPSELPGEEGLQAERGFSFYHFEHLASPAGLAPALQRLADRIFPRAAALRAIERDAQEYLRRLLETNASRVENDLKERLHQSRKRLEAEIRSALGQAVESAERAVERARAAQAAGRGAVEAELARLERLRARLTLILDSEPAAVSPLDRSS